MPSAIAPAERPSTLLERALRCERISVVVVLVMLPVFAWMWIVAMARDMYGPMTGASAWMMTLDWDLPHLLLLWAMCDGRYTEPAGEIGAVLIAAQTRTGR